MADDESSDALLRVEEDNVGVGPRVSFYPREFIQYVRKKKKVIIISEIQLVT